MTPDLGSVTLGVVFPLDRILGWLFGHSYRWRQNVLAVVLLAVAGAVYLSVR